MQGQSFFLFQTREQAKTKADSEDGFLRGTTGQAQSLELS